MYEKGKKLIKEIKEYYNGNRKKIKPKSVANILIENKMVYLKSIIKSVKGDLSEVIFYDIVERIVPKSKRFNFYETNYTDDIAITLERANAVSDALNQAKYKVYKKGFLLVDNNDYEMFIKGKFINVDLNSIKSKEYIDDNSVEYSYYKRHTNDLKSIGDVIDGYKNQNENRNNICERKMKVILSDMGIKYEYQKVFCINNKFYIADFYVPKNNVIIEVDGTSHDDIKGLKRDRERDNAFARHGVLTVRFRTHEVVDGNVIKEVLSKLLLDY